MSGGIEHPPVEEAVGAERQRALLQADRRLDVERTFDLHARARHRRARRRPGRGGRRRNGTRRRSCRSRFGAAACTSPSGRAANRSTAPGCATGSSPPRDGSISASGASSGASPRVQQDPAGERTAGSTLAAGRHNAARASSRRELVGIGARSSHQAAAASTSATEQPIDRVGIALQPVGAQRQHLLDAALPDARSRARRSRRARRRRPTLPTARRR